MCSLSFYQITVRIRNFAHGTLSIRTVEAILYANQVLLTLYWILAVIHISIDWLQLNPVRMHSNIPRLHSILQLFILVSVFACVIAEITFSFMKKTSIIFVILWFCMHSICHLLAAKALTKVDVVASFSSQQYSKFLIGHKWINYFGAGNGGDV